jgi:capsular exopolysaccharide synthesis family protein
MAKDRGGSETVRDAEVIGSPHPLAVMLSRPQSAAAEQYRVLRQRVVRAIATGAKRIAITSAGTGEGKTQTAVNLALAIGLARRQRVVLVDANLRAPAVHTLLGLRPAGGLAEVVAEELGLDEALWRFRRDDLWVLPAGSTRTPHASFESPRLGALLAELAGRFDAVIVDGPPILGAADMLTLAPELDAMITVVRAGRTARETLERALQALPELRLLGCVLQGVRASSQPRAAHRALSPAEAPTLGIPALPATRAD